LTEPTESGKPLTAISVKKLTEVLHNALETAVKWGYLAQPCGPSGETPWCLGARYPRLDRKN
jgi:hypothetical protein